MPATSKRQFRLMKAIESGKMRVPGLTPKMAKHYTESNVGKLKYARLKEKKSKA